MKSIDVVLYAATVGTGTRRKFILVKVGHMEKTVFNTLQKHRMIEKGDSVIVALSGGADSMALFHFFCAHKEQLGIRLAAAHFEHGLRGAASLQDADFVQAVCEQAGVQLFIEHGEMRKSKPPKGNSEEEWARKLRYTFFERLAAEHKAKVATAHTLSDNAETVLFHAIRGAGPRGLGGIPPVRDVFIRPMLEVSRVEVEAYCEANGLAYVVDATNKDTAYARNRLRLEVLPALEQVHAGAGRALARMAADMRELDAYLQQEAEKVLETACRETVYATGFDVLVLRLAARPVLKAALSILAGRHTTQAELDRLAEVVHGVRAGEQVGSGTVYRLYNGLLVAEAAANREAVPFEQPLGEGVYSFPGGYGVRVRVLEKREFEKSFARQREKTDKKSLTFVADYDKIPRYSLFRPRQPGDRYRPAGRNGEKTVKKWFNEAGVPRSQRACLPLLAEGQQVLWVWGNGFAQGTHVDESSARVLVLYAFRDDLDGPA